jgi:hypothetical protein
VKGVRNFENKVTVTVALQDKERFDGEIFDLDVAMDRVEGAALEFYEAAARRSVRQVFLEVAEKLSEKVESYLQHQYSFKILPISTSVLIINIYEHKNQIRPVGCRSGADWCWRICSSDT